MNSHPKIIRKKRNLPFFPLTFAVVILCCFCRGLAQDPAERNIEQFAVFLEKSLLERAVCNGGVSLCCVFVAPIPKCFLGLCCFFVGEKKFESKIFLFLTIFQVLIKWVYSWGFSWKPVKPRFNSLWPGNMDVEVSLTVSAAVAQHVKGKSQRDQPRGARSGEPPGEENWRAGPRPVGKQDGVPVGFCWNTSGAGKPLEVSIFVLQKWRR